MATTSPSPLLKTPGSLWSNIQSSSATDKKESGHTGQSCLYKVVSVAIPCKYDILTVRPAKTALACLDSGGGQGEDGEGGEHDDRVKEK